MNIQAERVILFSGDYIEKKMKNVFPSLKIKLMIWVLPIAFSGMLLMSILAFSYINAFIEEELTQSMLTVIDRSGELIDLWLKTLMLEPETIASTPAAKSINQGFELFDYQNINRHLVLHNKYPDLFQDIYGSNREGVYHTVIKQGEEIKIFEGNIANRPYFISIMNGGPTQITPPLISRTTGIPTVFIVAPILDEKSKPAGLVGTGISLIYIQKFVKEMKTGYSGYGFIFTTEGQLVAHSDLEFVIEQKVNLADLFSDRELIVKLQSDSRKVFRYEDDQGVLVFFSNRIPVTGWKLVSVISESELFFSANKMVRVLVLVAAITAFITGLALFLVMGKLISPLKRFVEVTGEIASGNFYAEDFHVHSRDEIGVLADSFNRMKINLQDSIERLRKSEDNYRGIFENSMEGIIQTTVDGKVLNANPAIVKMLHCESLEKLKETYTDIQNQSYINPEERPKIIRELMEKGSIRNKEVLFRCCDGEILWGSLSSFLVRDEEGHPLRIESLISDISQRKKMEKEKDKLYQELMQSQKMEAVGQLAGGVAHDFNNMLAAIMARSEMALLKMNEKDEYYDAFQDIYDAADHSANLTRQLLAFARKQSVSPENVRINSVIKSMLKLLRRLINEEMELSFLPGEKLWDVYFDPDQIGQIITNLCVNASDSISGYGKILIKTENMEIPEASDTLFKGVPKGEYVCLTIEDNGSGMTEEVQQHIFEPFFTTKEQGKGTGLGLATVYGIVKQNKSYINVYSEAGKGSIFRIYIPRSNVESPAGDIAESSPQMRINAEKILLVEDDRRLLKITGGILEKMGCQVIPASSPEQAIQIAADRENRFDLMLTDVIMPEMNGYDLYDRINAIRPGIKCLFMSGYSSDILAPKGVLDEGIHFIQKPFSINNLAAKINEVLAKS